MDRLPLLGGAYTARANIANCQRCINYFPESNPKDSPVPLTHYQRPGFRALQPGPTPEPGRGIYRASSGDGYYVVGQKLYLVNADWTLLELGTLVVAGTNPVSMSDNGTTLVLGDGSNIGYQVDLTSHAFSQIVDPTGLFNGCTKFDTIDTFILSNQPGSRNFISSLSNTITWDPTYIDGKTNYPDPLVTLVVNRHEILLLGALKSELWYDVGGAQFPFAELPGAYIEHGCVAAYSAASADISVYWLGQDLQGQGVVFRQRGYECKRISTHAIEYALQLMVAAGATLADAIGYTYQQGGHVFYVLTFPSGDQTWVWDESCELWHQRAWTDGDGILHRDRSNCFAFIHGIPVVGDWENGTLYALDQDYFVDTVLGVDYPLSCIRTFPHIMATTNSQGQPIMADGKRVQHNQFMADFQGGQGLAGSLIGLRWSDDRGNSWGQTVLQSSGEPGQYNTFPNWQGMGIARDRIYELSHSIQGPAPLNGAWITAQVLAT